MTTVEYCKAHDHAHCWKCSQDRVFELELQLSGSIQRGVELWKVLYHYTLHSDTLRRQLNESQGTLNAILEEDEEKSEPQVTHYVGDDCPGGHQEDK